MQRTKVHFRGFSIAEFANSVDLDEVAHYEPPHLDLYCSSLWSLNSQYDITRTKHFLKICGQKFCRLLFGSY